MTERTDRPAELFDHEPNPFGSTFPSEIATGRFADGSVRRVFIKHGVAGRHRGHGWWGGTSHESLVHREVLAKLDLGTPAFVAEWSSDSAAGPTIATEYLDGTRLGSSPTSRVVDAVRWAARLHRVATPVALACTGIRRYDDAYYLGWAERTLEYVRLTRPDCHWIEPVIRHVQGLLPALGAAGQVFIHGELYPDNVIVAGDRICAVDWQSAALGPGEIDLASLTEGWWPEDLREGWVAAYAAERWPGGPPPEFPAALEAARLYWPMRWLGDDPAWTGSSRRARYLDALRPLAERLGAA